MEIAPADCWKEGFVSSFVNILVYFNKLANNFFTAR